MLNAKEISPWNLRIRSISCGDGKGWYQESALGLKEKPWGPTIVNLKSHTQYMPAHYAPRACNITSMLFSIPRPWETIQPLLTVLFLKQGIFIGKLACARHHICFISFNPYNNLMRNYYEYTSFCSSSISLHVEKSVMAKVEEFSITCHIPITPP